MLNDDQLLPVNPGCKSNLGYPAGVRAGRQTVVEGHQLTHELPTKPTVGRSGCAASPSRGGVIAVRAADRDSRRTASTDDLRRRATAAQSPFGRSSPASSSRAVTPAVGGQPTAAARDRFPKRRGTSNSPYHTLREVRRKKSCRTKNFGSRQSAGVACVCRAS